MSVGNLAPLADVSDADMFDSLALQDGVRDAMVSCGRDQRRGTTRYQRRQHRQSSLKPHAVLTSSRKQQRHPPTGICLGASQSGWIQSTT